MPTVSLGVRSNRFLLLIFVGFNSCILATPTNANEYTNLEIREASQLEDHVPSVTETELVLPKDQPEAEAFLTHTFQPVIEYIREVPTDLLDEAAASVQRARVRLTIESRSKTQPFRLANDVSENLDEYKFRPLTVYGTLRNLRKVSEDGDQKLYFGQMTFFGTTDRNLTILVRSIPEKMPSGDKLQLPVSLTGFVVPITVSSEKADQDSSIEPLLVASRLNWHRPELDSELFAEVRDRTIGIEQAERFPMMKTLAHARLIDYQAQQQLAEHVWQEMQVAIEQERAQKPNPNQRQRSDILFVDLFKNPEVYRGKPVTLTGTLRSLAKWPNAEVNGFEIQTVYEARIFPEDGQSNPVIVNFLEKPKTIPISDDLNQTARFTGYFFKMYGYRDQADVLRVAPLFLARQIEAVPVPYTSLADEWILIVGGIILMLILGFVIWNRFNDRRFKNQWQHNRSDADPDLSQLE